MSRSKFDSGHLPSQKLLNLSACHPFVQQECEDIRPRIAARADLGCRPSSRLTSRFLLLRGSRRLSPDTTRHTYAQGRNSGLLFDSSRTRSTGWSSKGPYPTDASLQLVYCHRFEKRRVPLLLQRCNRFWVQPPWDGRDVVHRHSRRPHYVN